MLFPIYSSVQIIIDDLNVFYSLPLRLTGAQSHISIPLPISSFETIRNSTGCLGKWVTVFPSVD